ncbi:PAP fibrillin family protein [Gloeobacter kilaueensis]|uniref:PAP fibrillin family protein n=1 Tax=Gloeobacter kilaueensis (strain ATCC BAA-2537 / CCAP 1431/1 / ULC 316 / JS1) TaxID=1183438 RepID=U5QKU7_GLOK1|nr:PAP fibrillin family protein [Gloeobacter kilaueensis]AGY58239.1 PAP fibrillin family protein [Gloeobacter kilaueensis JS1]
MEAARPQSSDNDPKSRLLRQVARPRPRLIDLQPLICELQQRWQPPDQVEQLLSSLAGLWQLRFTTAEALSRFGVDQIPGLVERRRTYQFIDATNERVFNLAELALLGGAAQATTLIRARLQAGAIPRVYVRFERTALLWGGFDPYGSVEEAIRRIDGGEGGGVRLDIDSEGSLDTLYLDSQLRIAVGNRGSIFILTRP